MIIQIFFIAFRVYEVVILARVLLSWIHVDTNHPIVQWIYRLTEPVLEPIRRMIPMQRLGIDLSPLIVLLLMQFALKFLVRVL